MGARKPIVAVLQQVADKAGVDRRSVVAVLKGCASPAVERVVFVALTELGLEPTDLAPQVLFGGQGPIRGERGHRGGASRA
jgi:hypothetical protein